MTLIRTQNANRKARPHPHEGHHTWLRRSACPGFQCRRDGDTMPPLSVQGAACSKQ
ncbi:hypothetical protein BC826DRAFT_1061798 [Russula brevipes]|nr:hypothetical protein BC826DRAFT_1061798 [Russula brevipes]